MRSTPQSNRSSIPAHLTRVSLCIVASLLFISLAMSPIAFAGFSAEFAPGPNNPITQFLYPPKNVYVLAIGINKYKDPEFHLAYSVVDANAISESTTRNFKNSSVHVVRLTDEDATKAKIRDAIQQFALQAKASDLFILSFSGHAFVKTKNGSQEGYLIPSDAEGCMNYECTDESTLISGALLNSWMTQMHAQRQIMLLDMNQTDQMIPVFEDHWRKESCSVGPEASKRLLIVTNHGGGLEDATHGGVLTWSFLRQLGLQHDKGMSSAFRLQQGLYESLDPTIKADADLEKIKDSLTSARIGFRAELLGGDFLIDGPSAGVKTADLLRDSGLGALCYTDPNGTTRGGVPDDKATADAIPKSDQPTNYALVIASDHYKYWHELSNPIFDATTIENDLATTYGFKVENLWDPTRDQLRAKLNELHKRHYNHGDQLFIFIAGHGDYDETNELGYLVFPDTPTGHAYDSELSLLDLRSIIETIPVDHTFLVMDSCFAGSLDPTLGGSDRGDDYEPIPLATLQKRTADKKTRWFLTSGGKEYVPDGRPGSHSPFAALFIYALEKGTRTTGYLNLTQMPHYFERLGTVPRSGTLRGNQDGADFFFIPVAADSAATGSAAAN